MEPASPDALPQTLGVLHGFDRSLDYSFPRKPSGPPAGRLARFRTTTFAFHPHPLYNFANRYHR